MSLNETTSLWFATSTEAQEGSGSMSADSTPGFGGDVPQFALERTEAGIQIEVRGSFNPEILTPSWFENEGLLSAVDTETLKSVHLEPADIYIEGSDFAIEINREQFRLLTASEAKQNTYRDLVIGIFYLLRHTPLEDLRVTRYEHFGAGSSNHNVPVEVVHWESLIPDWGEVLTRPQLVSFSVRVAGPQGATTVVTIEPSAISNAQVFISCSYEYGLGSGDSPSDALQAILKDRWDDVLSHADETSTKLLNKLIPGAPEDVAR